MASTEAARRLTEAHRLAQARIGAQTVLLMQSVWPLLNPADLDGSSIRWVQVATPIINQQHGRSASLAANYYRTFRALEIGTAAFTPIIEGPVPPEVVATSLRVTGPVAVKQRLLAGLPLARALDLSAAGSAGAAMRHALAGGRGTLAGSIRADERTIGWARVTSGSPCSFCAMLASRGAVYSAETVDFETHDNCSCSIEPVYSRGTAWPPGSERWRDLWQQARSEPGDTSRNFRRLVEAIPS
jgi:hypothetical protein